MVFAFGLHSINSSLRSDLVTQISLSLNVGKLWFNTTLLSIVITPSLAKWFDICSYQPLVYMIIVVHSISLLTFLPSHLIHSFSLSRINANSFMVAIHGGCTPCQVEHHVQTKFASPIVHAIDHF